MSQNVKKILITGVESTGKSTLAVTLATYFNTVWVKEYARTYLNDLNRKYVLSDLLKIAKGQIAAEDILLNEANQYLFCDTGMLVLKIWSEYKFGQCDPFILKQLRERKYDLYILCSVGDVVWEDDPLRENPDLEERLELHEMYKKELKKLNVPYIEVSGSITERRQQIIDWLEKWGLNEI